jgi:hypothetical protein
MDSGKQQIAKPLAYFEIANTLPKEKSSPFWY